MSSVSVSALHVMLVNGSSRHERVGASGCSLFHVTPDEQGIGVKSLRNFCDMTNDYL